MSGLKKVKASVSSDSPLEELDHIMSEIEEIQHEIDSETQAVKKVTASAPAKLKMAPQAVPAPMEDSVQDLVAETLEEKNEIDAVGHDLQPDGDSVSLEETLSHLKEEEETTSGQSVFDQVSQAHDPHDPHDPMEEQKNEGVEMEENEYPETESQGCLTMTLTGNMTLKLKYEFDGQEVVVGFADRFLNVKLADGTEFKVPVHRAKPHRKAA